MTPIPEVVKLEDATELRSLQKSQVESDIVGQVENVAKMNGRQVGE